MSWSRGEGASDHGGSERPPMPIISIFFGIVIRMYHDDHPPPHFHASYQGFEAFVAIATGDIVEGKLPKNAARLVKQWALKHQDELMAT